MAMFDSFPVLKSMTRNSRRSLRLAAELLFVAIVALSTVSSALSQTTGKIAGTVVDASGETLPGVNVFIEGSTIGTSTNLDGQFSIIGVSPGKHVVVASFVGFSTQRVLDVAVNAGLTATVNFTMTEEVFEGEEVVITAVRALVQKDVTATTAIVDGDRIRAIPVESFAEVLALQAGVVDGSFRGGRRGEVGYWVDGVPVTDVYDGTLAAGVENNSVQEVQVITGAFNAEFGQAMSGIVNIVTREGGNNYSGGFSAFAGDYASTNDELFMNIGDISPTATKNIEVDFGGPIIKDKLFFFVSGRYFDTDGHLWGQRVFSAEDVGVDQTGRLATLNPSGSGDSSFVAMKPFELVSGQAKLTWRITPKIKLSANFLNSTNEFTDYWHQLLFLPDNLLRRSKQSRTSFLKLTHSVNAKTFYELGATNIFTDFEQRLFDDPLDSRYLGEQSFFGFFTDPIRTSNFLVGGTDNSRFSRSTETNLVKFDLTSQVNTRNMMKVGLEFRQHELQSLSQRTTVLEGAPLLVTDAGYNEKPIEASAYVQDKIEFGNLILNLGLRFDYFDSKGRVLRDGASRYGLFLEERIFEREGDCNPLVTSPCEFRLDENGNPIARLTADGEVDFRPDAFFEDAGTHSQLSPRVGLSFPITEGGVVHFSYGWFFQIPNFEFLYQNPYYALGTGGSGLIGLLGNPGLKPQKTTSGEIGLKQELTSSTAIEVTAYFRDIRNLAGSATEAIQIAGTGARYGQLANSDFGFVKGVILRFDQYFGGNFSMNVDYTFQIAEGNASDPSQAFQAAAARQELEQKIVSLNWDQLHTVNSSITYSADGKWGFGVIGTYGSGLPFTPVRTTLQSGGDRPPGSLLLNSDRKPSNYNVDLNLYKNFKVGGSTIQVYTKIDNVFDTRTETQVYGDTGRGTFSLQQQIDAGPFAGDQRYLDQWYSRPDFFREPRRVVFGTSLRF